jgi:glucoamylase
MSYSRESCETFPLCIHGTSLTFAAVALADLVFVAKYYENAFDVGDRRRTISSPPRKPRLRSDVSGLPMANKGASLECRTLLREWLEKMDQLVTWLQAPPPDSQKLYRNCAKSSRLPALVKFHKFVRTHFERELIDGSDSRVTGSIEWLLEFRRFLSGRQSKIRSVGTSGTASPPTNAVAAASSQSEGEMGPPKEPYRSPKLAAEQSSSSSVVTKEAPASVMLPLPSPSSSSSSSSSSEDAALAAKKSDYRRVTDGRGGYWMVPKKPRDQTYTVKKSGSRPPSSTSPVPTSARVVPASSSSSPKPAAPSTVAGISNSSQANTSSSMDVSVPGGEDRHSNRRDGCDATVAVEFHATTPSLGDVVDHQIMMDPAEESLAMLVDGAEYDSSRRHELIAAMAHFDHHATVQSMLPFTSIADVPPFDSQGQDHEGFFDDGYSSGFSDDTSPLSPPLTPIGQFDGTYSTTASTGTTGLMSLSSATPSSSLHSSSSLRKSPRSQPALSLDDGQDSSSRQQLTSSFSSNDADSRSRLRMLQALDDESRRVISTDSLRNPEDDVPIDRTIHHRHHEETMTTSASSDEGTTTHDDDDDGEETVAELQVCGDSSNSMEVDEASASLANAVSDQSPCQSRVMASRHAVAAATMAERSHPIANSISLRGWTIIGPPAGHVYW